MEQKLVIRTETPPERCEICHQSDLFDPFSGQCARCNSAFVATAKTEPLKGVQYVKASVATQNRPTQNIPKKKRDHLFLVSMLALISLTAKNLTVSKTITGITFAAIAATYLYKRYRPDTLPETASPEGSEREGSATLARWGIFFTGTSLADFVSIIEKGFNYKTYGMAFFFAGAAVDYWNKFYKAIISKSSAGEAPCFQSDIIVKLVESLLLTTSICFDIAGLITNGLSFWSVLFSIVTGAYAVTSWSDWNKARKAQDKSLPVQNIPVQNIDES